MSNTIVKQGIEVSFGYCGNVLIGVISPMSKTRSKQGIEGKLEDLSNVSKTILNQVLDGSLGY